MTRATTALLLSALSLCAACGDDDATPPPPPAPDAGPPGVDAGMSAPFLASCVYRNTFSASDDCREYRGTWTEERAAADCMRVFLGRAGTFTAGAPCMLPDVIGVCVVGDVAASGYTTASTGTPDRCGNAQTACETFAGGTFMPASVCESGCTAVDPSAGPAFTPLATDCRDPLAGEPAGSGPGGQVCTPTIISGSTEPGRRFADYASCAAVRTQRPYYPRRAGTTPPTSDPRLADTAYLAEVAWLKGEAEASACACCHTASDTPSGAAIWDTEAGPLWTDTVSDAALAMLAGFTDSTAFGFLQPAENNGFDRTGTGLPTTDVARLRRFAEAEFMRRGLTLTEARALPPFAPFFRDLIDYTPGPCAEGVGVDAGGAVRWKGGAARYVAVLEEGSKSPGVPPNWDTPAGTLWSIYVPPDAAPMACGTAFGTLPENAIQRIPAMGAPAPLVSGQTYYLHVQRDIAQPLARCLFTAP
jgi:hypothetical protein